VPLTDHPGRYSPHETPAQPQPTTFWHPHRTGRPFTVAGAGAPHHRRHRRTRLHPRRRRRRTRRRCRPDPPHRETAIFVCAGEQQASTAWPSASVPSACGWARVGFSSVSLVSSTRISAPKPWRPPGGLSSTGTVATSGAPICRVVYLRFQG
jgi:hypothetical protein